MNKKIQLDNLKDIRERKEQLKEERKKRKR